MRWLTRLFPKVASYAAHACGRPLTFMFALSGVIVWGISGPFFGYSDTWQLVANTVTTLITFLVVFLIQNSQNRETAAIHLKLDELIRVTKDARNELMDAELLTDVKIESLHMRGAKP